MKTVFADTLYWVAISRPIDSWRAAALQARRNVGEAVLVTTDEVLAEFLTAMAKGGHWMRATAVCVVRAILVDPGVRIIPQSRESFLNGLTLFENRPDKSYSLTDCISMNVMKAEGITEVLTNDGHFAQEGFQVLIKQ
jgi:predicted nucleic acid-binding protein